jgi:hypothetical protein
MPAFSAASLRKLATLDPRLQAVLRAAIAAGPDFTIISAKRTPAEQAALVAEGKSQTLDSKHLTTPSLAVAVGGLVLVLPAEATTGKYAPEHAAALAALGEARDFAADHAGAFRDIGDAGSG